MTDSSKPRMPKRRSELIFHQLDEETVVYNPGSGTAHCLGPEVSVVFSYCDGVTQIDQVTVELSSLWPEQGERILAQSLAELSELGFLGSALQYSSRRTFLKKGMLPLVLSVTLAPPAAALSCVTGHAGCGGNCGCPCRLGAAASCTRVCARRYRRRNANNGLAKPCAVEQIGGLRCRNRNRYHPNCTTARNAVGNNQVYKCCNC